MAARPKSAICVLGGLGLFFFGGKHGLVGVLLMWVGWGEGEGGR